MSRGGGKLCSMRSRFFSGPGTSSFLPPFSSSSRYIVVRNVLARMSRDAFY